MIKGGRKKTKFAQGGANRWEGETAECNGAERSSSSHAGDSGMGFPPENTSKVDVGEDFKEIKAGQSSYKGRTDFFPCLSPLFANKQPYRVPTQSKYVCSQQCFG